MTHLHVFTECKENYFSFNCEEMCNGTCKGCNRFTGVCENGCHAGWRGKYCHEGDFVFYSKAYCIIGIHYTHYIPS